jgi:hypothetical protein
MTIPAAEQTAPSLPSILEVYFPFLFHPVSSEENADNKPAPPTATEKQPEAA